jgi:hypothetical protein
MGNATKPSTALATDAAPVADAAPAADAAPKASDHEVAAQKRAAARAANTADTEAADRLAALAEERRGYVQRGQTDRVKQVDAQIALWSSK